MHCDNPPDCLDVYMHAWMSISQRNLRTGENPTTQYYAPICIVPLSMGSHVHVFTPVICLGTLFVCAVMSVSFLTSPEYACVHTCAHCMMRSAYTHVHNLS